MTVMSNEDSANPGPYEPPVRGSVDHAEWLGDKLHCTNDYGKEAAFMLVEQAKALVQMRYILWNAKNTIEALDGTNVENEKLVDSYREWLQSLNSLPHSSTRAKLTLATGIEAQVCRDIADRQARGIAKYGTTVAENPLHTLQWLQHMYEELLDGAVYAKRCMAEIKAETVEADRKMAPVVETKAELMSLLPRIEMWMKADYQAVAAATTLRLLINRLP
jgi:hypothetical protein